MHAIRSIISTGQGRLHLIQSAIAIQGQGVDVKVITGWVPGKLFSDKLINNMGRLIGRSNLAYGLRKRSPEGLSRNDIMTCSFSEFYIQFLFMLTGRKILSRDTSALMGWKAFGTESKKYIRNSEIFHVRSGGGRAGAIRKARAQGMKIVVDHSIAHPKEIKRQLGKLESESKNSKYINISDRFWNSVLEDCEEADMLLVNSDYVKDTFLEQGYPAEKISVIHLGIDESFYDLKKTYQSDKIKLLFTGNFGFRKGAHIIIQAIEILIQQNIQFTLDVIGNVSAEVQIPEWFRNHPGITLHGHMPQDQMKKFLATSDVYIFPTFVEGAAQSVKEAMAAGLPVITTVNSGAPVQHRQNGYLIKDDDAVDLASAIIVLSKDEELRSSMGKQAAATIRKSHTWSNYAKEVTELYKSMIGA
ncbi:Glycosyltransferase Family 4 [Chitinophaga sp. CF118]|uniref:glycosyltransferase family 4 protein n=1 Tax=Chitinophaga sp. CF118 TaxID=1884367 RepID=UPI0008F445E7|nr:glycosyltransferase family 4 protein [Chitinophaga sp. CF118]SFE02998.1 Glycosyltransferase Family 4 [Chitinophaga sp. CF118]